MLNNLTIKTMLQLAAVIVFCLMSTLIGVNSVKVAGADQKLDDHEAVMSAAFLLKDLRFHTVQIQQFLTDVGATADEGGYGEAKGHLDVALKGLDKLAILIPDMAKVTTEVKSKVSILHHTGVEMARAYVAEGREAGNRIMKRPVTGLDDASAALAKQLSALIDTLDQRMYDSTTAAQRGLHQAEQTVLWLGLLVMAGIGLIMGYFYFRVVPPLRELRDSMDGIAQGSRDLTVTMVVKDNSEIGQVAASFNVFVENIRRLVSRVARTNASLASAGDRMSTASSDTLHGMQKLQGETDQVATAMNEMNATVQEVANHAGLASESAQQADSEARNGEIVVRQNMEAIADQAEKVTEAANAILKLRDDVGDIGSILDVIRGIADQTNLLALNAAIEAARAGEQGRGFAVVADEVRVLAQRTQQSTQEIQNKIEKLQGGADNAVAVMEQGRAQTEASVERADQARVALENIARAVATITEMNQQIAHAADAQTTVAEEINRNVNNISSEAEQTVENAHQTESMTGEMAKLLEELNEVVKGFNIGADSGLDLSSAKAAHLAWKSRLRAFLDGQASLTEDQAVSHHHCAFGKWYDTEGLEKYGSLQQLRDVEPPHAELHKLIKEIVRLKAAGQLAEAEAAYSKVAPLSTKIVGLLNDVERLASV